MLCEGFRVSGVGVRGYGVARYSQPPASVYRYMLSKYACSGGRNAPVRYQTSEFPTILFTQSTCFQRTFACAILPAYWVHSAGFRVKGARYRVHGAGCRVKGEGYRVQGAGLRVGCRVTGIAARHL